MENGRGKIQKVWKPEKTPKPFDKKEIGVMFEWEKTIQKTEWSQDLF